MILLTGDIGGTKTALALFSKTGSGTLTPVKEAVYLNQSFVNFEAILTQFLEGAPSVTTGVFAVAGPIQNQRCQMTNLSWDIDAAALETLLHIPRVLLLNDVQAIAYGTRFLTGRQRVTLNSGLPDPNGPIGTLAAGTGLGEAFLCWTGNRYLPIATEGGHTDFAPRSDQEIKLLQFLSPLWGHVSIERILSGAGLVNLYRFLKETGFADEPPWLGERLALGDPAEGITAVAREEGHPLCQESIRLFASIYGAEAGNFALKVGATGGIFVGGGIAPKILSVLQAGHFMNAFLSKGRFQEWLNRIPVHVILAPETPLIGAVHYAMDTVETA